MRRHILVKKSDPPFGAFVRQLARPESLQLLVDLMLSDVRQLHSRR